MAVSQLVQPPPTRLWPYALTLALCATLAVGASLGWNLHQQENGTRAVALTLARTTLEKDVFYRRWNARHGGVYAQTSLHTPANPYLLVPERDLITPSGRKLTMINPAYMTRQVHELGALATGIVGHITSLKPIRPGNAPDPWERKALQRTELGAPEVYEVVEKPGEPVLRLLLPLYVEKACLPCHQQQGYQVGEVRGGLSVTVPMQTLYAQGRRETWTLVATHLVLWGLALGFIMLGRHRLARGLAERDQARRELKTLSGLLPICSHCKKIRADDGHWEHMETYITRHSEADFSHGLCPDCVAEHYPGLFEQQPAPKKS